MATSLIEKSFLGHLLWVGSSEKQNDLVHTISERIDPRYITDEKHRIIYEHAIMTMLRRGRTDLTALIASLTNSGMLELAGGMDYISNLVLNRDRSTDLIYLSELVYQSGKKQDLIDICTETINKIKKDGIRTYEEIAYEIDENISGMRTLEKNTTIDIPKTVKQIIEKSNNVERYGLFGYSWGIEKLNYLTGGIETGKSYVVGATKKSGKSRFVINSIHALIGSKIKSLFLSMEMGGESVTTELIARFTGIENTRFRAKLTKDIEADAVHVGDVMAPYLTIDVQGFLSVGQIRHKVSMAAKVGVKVVFLDYLQRMNFQHNPKETKNSAMIISETVARLADIAREFNVGLVFLSQLRNDADNQQADLSFLKDSGGIAEAVDCIIILNNQDRINKVYDPQKKTNEIWFSVEQRSGVSGMVKCTVELGRSTFTQKFEEGDECDQPPYAPIQSLPF